MNASTIWTQEPPTAPGYYWFRASPDKLDAPRMTRVFYYVPEQEYQCRLGPLDSRRGVYELVGYWWAGPIESPPFDGQDCCIL